MQTLWFVFKVSTSVLATSEWYPNADISSVANIKEAVAAVSWILHPLYLFNLSGFWINFWRKGTSSGTLQRNNLQRDVTKSREVAAFWWIPYFSNQFFFLLLFEGKLIWRDSMRYHSVVWTLGSGVALIWKYYFQVRDETLDQKWVSSFSSTGCRCWFPLFI